MNPLRHYILYGKDGFRLPLPYNYDIKYKKDYAIIYNSDLFDEGWFREKYGISQDIDPIIYYLENWATQDLNPSPHFDTKWYLTEYVDVKKNGMNPLRHYILYGKKEGRISKLYTFSELDKLNLKHCIRGRKNFYFLINDTNNEIKQHFDENYKNQFNKDVFNQDFVFKKKYFGKQYYYFIVPDKSIICKNLIPFKFKSFKRNLDLINIPDFSEKLDEKCYYDKDTHQNIEGAKRLSYYILNYIDPSFTQIEYNKYLKECNITEKSEPHDLLSHINWSYSFKEKKNIKINKIMAPTPIDIQYLNIPERFSKNKNRASEYIYNPNSYSNQRALIFRDSSTTPLKHFLCLYFREMFLYWDHLSLNKDLIDWFNPDMIIEIRIERFIENYFTPDWINELRNNTDI